MNVSFSKKVAIAVADHQFNSTQQKNVVIGNDEGKFNVLSLDDYKARVDEAGEPVPFVYVGGGENNPKPRTKKTKDENQQELPIDGEAEDEGKKPAFVKNKATATAKKK